jgi:hypothetical protein
VLSFMAYRSGGKRSIGRPKILRGKRKMTTLQMKTNYASFWRLQLFCDLC